MANPIQPTRPLPQAHPDYLRALASWFGVSAPSAETARILDIGCGSGSHLLGLAAGLPRAKLVGIDSDAAAIELAQKAAAAANLRNIRFMHADASVIKMKAGVFDYVICHDVFSHVGDACRSAILRQIAHVLSDDGVALVSYDAYPGWKIADWWREVMALKRDPQAESQAITERAAQDVALMQAVLPKEEAWCAPLRLLGNDILQGQPQTVNRLLNPEHRAYTLTAFMNEASGEGLAYIGDAHYQNPLISPLRGEAHTHLIEQYGNDLIGRQQYYDYLTNRGQRQTLLVKQRDTALTDPGMGMRNEVLAELHIQGGFKPPLQGRHTWQSLRQPAVEIADKDFVREVCGRLNQAGLSTVSVKALLASVEEAQRADVAKLVLELIANQAVQVRASALQIDGSYDEQPRLMPYAWQLLPLMQAHPNVLILANRWQQPLKLDEIMHWLMVRMTGQYSDKVLAKALAKACAEGKFDQATLAALCGGDIATADWQNIAHNKVESTIKWLAAQGLLSQSKA